MQHLFDGAKIVLHLLYTPRTISENFGLHVRHHITIRACIVLKESACRFASHQFTAMGNSAAAKQRRSYEENNCAHSTLIERSQHIQHSLKVQSQF